ncbi:NADH dehydrogenase [ubiquinone] 1 alpha subcomplex assembly factor 8 isoform X1 [Salvelinus namaycush]|uniref:NADH dehydrogenase [ubiquinone] 1 alpha subcomplex assembly factor 8 isoform X1 n=1 Tax=Salvelinus namaycush TaxID=8040 RepID=A0A8U0PUX0_SALNM|nr:NADH dehydrogenase [ubiquinone] 1 alpha subcomplex assembly factor 8 isoform X1 [Salvelinus namaycush]
MSGTNVWTRSRERMRRFPELFAQCSGEAAAYGKCVTATTTGRQELRKDLCGQEGSEVDHSAQHISAGHIVHSAGHIVK